MESKVSDNNSFTGKKIELKTFRPQGKSWSEKLAHLYVWAMEKYPYLPVSDSLAARAITGNTRVSDSDVEQVRNSKFYTKKILMKEYNRTLISAPGFGSRASVDDDDKAEHSAVAAASRVKSAKDNFKRIVDSINMKNLTDGPHKTWLLKSKAERAALFSDSIWKALEPPKK